MTIGEKLLELRKAKGLSQEELAEQLNVTRQTISKWETDQSTPDFDKIVPLCNLYSISADELLMGGKVEKKNVEVAKDSRKKKALFTASAVVLYILSIVAIIFFAEIFRSPNLGVCVFFILIAIATAMLIYCYMVYDSKEKTRHIPTKAERLYRKIMAVVSTVVLIIYLAVSFLTMAWHATWILWVVYGLISEIIKLVFEFRGSNIYEEK